MKAIYKIVVVALAIFTVTTIVAAPRGSGDWQRKIEAQPQAQEQPAVAANKRALKKRGVRHFKVPN